MAKLNPAGSCDVLFPEDSYEDYYNPAPLRSSYPVKPESDYSSDLQHICKGEGWTGRHDYAVIPPAAKRRNKKRSDSGNYSSQVGQEVVHASPVVGIHQNSPNGYGQRWHSYSRRGNSVDRGHSFSQNNRSSYEALDSSDRDRHSPERRYSLRAVDNLPYNAQSKRISYSETNSIQVPRVPDKRYPACETEGDNSFEISNSYGDDSATIKNSVNSLNNSNSSRSSSSSYNNKDNYANPYRKRVSVPEEDFHWRRRTWSPSNSNAELVKSNMGVGSSFQKKNRSYHSSDVLEKDMGPVYEDITEHHVKDRGPPQITPISGKLSQSHDQVVLRPIAFKPVLPRPNSYVCTPTQSVGEESGSRPASAKSANQDGGYKSASHDDGYISQGSHSASIVSQVSAASLQTDTNERSVSFVNSDCNRASDRPESFNSSNVSRISSNHGDGYIQTPSPSDSGVSELEIMLREKDAEILHLRETMEHNERVIFQVSEEKYRMWQMEMQDLSADFQRRLKAQQQKTFKMEQAFMLQVYKLQQEKRKMQDDFQALSDSKDTMGEQLSRISEDLKTAAVQRDEANATANEKSNEVSLLTNQLKDAKSRIDTSEKDFVVLKTQLTKTQDTIVSKENSMKKLQDDLSKAKDQVRSLSHKSQSREVLTQTDPVKGTLGGKGQRSKVIDHENGQLQHELECRNREIKQQREHFETERQQWMDEKDKVIRYQKQLQLNYVQMIRKNKSLETEIENLSADLEGRDLKLIQGVQTGEESLC